MRKYFIMMIVRVACFVAAVAITPYGWHTWVLALGAVFLPYFAVVVANIGTERSSSGAEQPERALPAGGTTPVQPASNSPMTIRIQEQRPGGDDRTGGSRP